MQSSWVPSITLLAQQQAMLLPAVVPAVTCLRRRRLARKHAAGAVQQLRQLAPRDGGRAVVHVRERVQHLRGRLQA